MELLAWFIVAALGGALIGIVIGATLAHKLVSGRYTHLITDRGAPPQVARPKAYDRDYDPHYDGYYR